MCSSSLNTCANGFNLKCWLLSRIIQLLMLLFFASCRNNCIMHYSVLVNTWLIRAAVFFHSPISQSGYLCISTPFQFLFPPPIFFTTSRENREHLATSHLLPPRATMLGKISEVSREAWLSLSLLCHCPACYSRGVFGMWLQVDPSILENTVRFHLTLTDWHTQTLCMCTSLLSAKFGLCCMFCEIIFS